MVKKLLSIVLATMLLCSIAVVSNAETTEKTVWSENFDSRTAEDFLADTSSLWITTAACKEAHGNYDGSATGSAEFGHFHLSDGWVMQRRDYDARASVRVYDKYTLKSGDHGKMNSDKSLSAENLYSRASVTFKNDFEGGSVDVTNGSAVGFSFEWYDSTKYARYNHHNIDREIIATVILENEEGNVLEEREISLGTIRYDRFYSALETVPTSATISALEAKDATFESWNDFLMYISKNSVKVRSASAANEQTLNIAQYDPTTNKWATSNESGYHIKSVEAVQVYLKGSDNYVTAQTGIDNLKVWVEDEGIPAELAKKEMPNFINFAAVNNAPATTGNGNTFTIGSSLPVNKNYSVQLLGTHTDASNVIKPSLVIDNNDTVKGANTSNDAWLKITSDSSAGLVNATAMGYVVRFDKADNQDAARGDIVRASFDIKLNGDNNANSTSRVWNVTGNFVNGADNNILGIAGDGTVLNSDVKLNEEEWYSVDIVYDLTNAVPVATVYINGVAVIEKSLTGTYNSSDCAVGLYYEPILNETQDAYLANTVYLDNLCCQIYKGGDGAYNFDKSLANANNEVVKAAKVDFVNGVIAPISAEWTVGEFKELGLTNAVVVDNSGAVVSDDAALLKNNKIQISGDYGKTMTYAVSENGATCVGKDIFRNDYVVFVKQGNLVAPNTSVNTTDALTAKAYYKNGKAVVVFAEYTANNDGSINKLVNIKIGEEYTPSAVGNKIKVFAIENLTSIKPIAPDTIFSIE